MSHASCIVALSLNDVEQHNGVEQAVAFQMEPFEEKEEWFQDGSRWDWYSIGGRYTGRFAMGYEPHDDPRNYEICWLCQGGGMRNDELGLEHRRKDPTYTCNGCNGTGKMLKHASKFVEVGNICQRGDLTETSLRQGRRKSAENLWAKWQAEQKKDDFHREHVYGLRQEDTLETLIERSQAKILSAYAFLKDRRWCENERLGWFATPARTECEIKAAEEGREHEGRCITTCPKTGAKIINWAEDEDRWHQMYWPRFLRNLPSETTLVMVDYHV